MSGGRPKVREEPDERLLIEAAKLDPRRFADLYELNFDRVYAYITLRVRDRAEAQDIASEVFHHALENLARFEWRGVPFCAWLYRIAANAIVERTRRAAREQTGDPPEICVEPDLDDVNRRARVFARIEELPEDQSRVLLLRFVEEKSIRDVAKEIGRSEGAVKQLQFRALANLRNLLGEENA
ncbi:MAG: sigma-70 family RNA polymerase sigma factor [Acidobacteriia bacterium]|nr:sigma-70 family RNA polymerase sigma factor [Terriglobia bacterium]